MRLMGKVTYVVVVLMLTTCSLLFYDLSHIPSPELIAINTTDSSTSTTLIPLSEDMPFLPLPNEIPKVKLDSSILIRSSTVVNISCIPYSIGFSAQQDRRIFGYKPSRKTCLKNDKDLLLLEDQRLTAECFDHSVPFLVKGSGKDDEMLGNVEFILNLTNSLDSTEYFYMKCAKNPAMMLLTNRYNLTAAENARKLWRKLLTEEKATEKKPLTVILLIIDSVSRQSFYRNMPFSIEFINENLVSGKYSENFAVYDFLFTHAIGPKTLPNLIPLLSGSTWASRMPKVFNSSIVDLETQKTFTKNEQESLWSDFKRKGFVTMFSYDTVNDYLSTIVGRKINTDHVVSNFWHMARNFFTYSDFTEQVQCLGNKYPHEYSLDYLKEYMKNYKGFNRFAYTHLSVAHEKSGQRLSLSDRDFKQFLSETLQFYTENSEEVALFVLGDHGRPKLSPVAQDSKAEQYIPFFFLITSQGLLPSAHSTLQMNTNRLVTRYDIYKTIRSLVEYPYNDFSQIKEKSKSIHTDFESFNLFFEEINETRHCEKAGIPESACFCKNYQEMSTKSWHEDRAIEYFVKTSVSNINRFNSKKIYDKMCSSITLDQVIKILFYSFDPLDEFAPIHYEIWFNTTDSAVFKVHGTRASSERYEKTQSREYFDTYTRYQFKGKHGASTFMTIKIWDLFRVGYENIEAADSVCRDFQGKMKKREFILSKSETCAIFCDSQGFSCIEPKLHKEELDEIGKFGKILHAEKGNTFRVLEEFIIITSGRHCETLHNSNYYLCYCEHK